jgi:hypothetical protein
VKTESDDITAERIKLSEFFSLFEPTHILGTTYTVSLTFFESVVFPYVKKGALRKCVILCDQFGFRRAMVEAGSLNRVSSSYMVVVPPASRTLHAKVWLMLNADKAALLVGSGNLTQSGFMQNNELFDVVDVMEHPGSQILLQDIQVLVSGLGGHCRGLSKEYRLLADYFSEVQDILQNLSSKANGTDSNVRLLTSFHGSFLDQLSSVISSCDLSIAAPYFGGSKEGLSLLTGAVRARNVRVFPGLDDEGTVDMPVDQVASISNTRICRLRMSESGGFAHLKLYGFLELEGDKAWLFNGSVNCTKAALTGDNIEAGILRSVSRTAIDSYFEEGKSQGLPKSRPADHFDHGEKWMSICAANLGSMLDLVTVPSPTLPLTDVAIQVQNGPNTIITTKEGLFFDGPSQRVPWKDLNIEAPKLASVYLLEVTGRDSKGSQVKASCYVDDLITLTSDPSHRSALQTVIQALTGGEEMSGGNVAAVFNLLDVFRPGGLIEEATEKETASKKDGEKIEAVEKLALWPPVLLRVDAGRLMTSKRIVDAYWLQRMMALLFSGNGRSDRQEEEEEPEDGDLSKPTKLARKKKPTNIFKRDWEAACKQYYVLTERLKRSIIVETMAGHIVSISLAALLVVLAFRRRYQSALDDKQEVEPISVVLRDFMTTLFSDREQASNYVRQSGVRYPYPTFPPISEDIRSAFGVSVPPDICSIIFTLFLYVKANLSSISNRRFPTIPWLRFRKLAGGSLDKDHLDVDFLEAIWKQYLMDQANPVAWFDVQMHVDEVFRITWEKEQCYSDLSALILFAQGKIDEPNLQLQHLKENLGILRRRLEAKLPWYRRVDHVIEVCVIDGCSKANLVDPQKRVLRALSPVICDGCGTLLVPDELYDIHPGFPT